MTQHGIKKGLKVFGEAGTTAVLKELTQPHQRSVIEPKILNEEDKKAALNYLMFLKKKSTGQIKGRRCADGCKQRKYI
eukprot:scaffold37028_cov57-Attheya_sp.AAC.2